MTWTRSRTLIAGIALIVAVNAVALLGIAYNRSGEPDSLLRLSQRELPIPYGWKVGTENTGVSLNLTWQMGEGDDTQIETPGGYRNTWINAEKLAELGFDVPTELKSVHQRQLAKEVLLVLELDGPARQQKLERLRQQLAKEEALLLANPDKKEFESRTKSAKLQLTNEESKNSRLYVINAGLDQGRLRTQYPDRSRYAIVRGKMRAIVIRRDNNEYLTGTISGLLVDHINVPLELQPAIGPKLQRDSKDTTLRTYEFDIAFGKRLEPWIVASVVTQ